MNKRVPYLDFLRALAIFLVMSGHFFRHNPQYGAYINQLLKLLLLYGWVGVDLFLCFLGILSVTSCFWKKAAMALILLNFTYTGSYAYCLPTFFVL